eukprot:357002-Chlamydomonas_euryale.AAC.8
MRQGLQTNIDARAVQTHQSNGHMNLQTHGSMVRAYRPKGILGLPADINHVHSLPAPPATPFVTVPSPLLDPLCHATLNTGIPFLSPLPVNLTLTLTQDFPSCTSTEGKCLVSKQAVFPTPRAVRLLCRTLHEQQPVRTCEQEPWLPVLSDGMLEVSWHSWSISHVWMWRVAALSSRKGFGEDNMLTYAQCKAVHNAAAFTCSSLPVQMTLRVTCRSAIIPGQS